MRKFKEVLRLKYEHHLTNRKIAKSCAMSHVTVGKYLDLAKQAEITWPLPYDINDSQLAQRLYANVSRHPSDKPVMPSMAYLFQEMKRKHVTLQLLWFEYKQGRPDGYQDSYFCELYNRWRKGLDISLRQEHLAGEKTFIDYAGQTVPIFNGVDRRFRPEGFTGLGTRGGFSCPGVRVRGGYPKKVGLWWDKMDKSKKNRLNRTIPARGRGLTPDSWLRHRDFNSIIQAEPIDSDPAQRAGFSRSKINAFRHRVRQPVSENHPCIFSV